jgi:hypothetical protein
MKKTILAVLAMGALSCALFSQQAQAAQVTGEIHMAGDVVLNSVDLSSSTAVNHWISVQNHLEKATTFGATGDFAVIPTGTEADMTHPWTFIPSTPTAPLWNIPAHGFSFDLASIIFVNKQGDNFLNILASGTVHATGFDDTPALFSFTVNNPDGLTHLTYSFANATVTIPTAGGCVLTQGFWKNHPKAWPVAQLQLGNVNYDQQQLLDILHQPVRGNGLVSLAHQLIAAKLNIAAGADPSCIQQTLADADALIGDLVVPPVGDGFLAPSDVSALVKTLTDYNEGRLCAPSCD